MDFIFFLIGVGCLIAGHWIIGLIFIAIFLFSPPSLN